MCRKIEPLVACPNLPSNVKPVRALKDVSIDQVVIGSCTNGRISDLRMAAKILRGKKVKSGVRLIVIPATQKIYLEAVNEGLAKIFVEAGGVFSTPTCGPCLGGHMGILAEGERAIATTNRNFVGRMGHPKSEVLCRSAFAFASRAPPATSSPSDDAPSGVARAELLALAADAHAWDVLEDALARYELAAAQLGADEPCASSTFVHELRRALEAGPPPPGGGRVGAVRIARLGELAGEELDLLVVVDANEGALPVTEGEGGLVTRALAAALRKRSVRAAPLDTELRSARQLGALALAASGAARIQLFFRSADDGGAVLAPAPLVLWLVRSGVVPTSWSEGPARVASAERARARSRADGVRSGSRAPDRPRGRAPRARRVGARALPRRASARPSRP